MYLLRMLLFGAASFGKLWAAGHKTHPTRDQRNSQPAREAHLFMQHESRDERQQHVAKRACRKNVSQVRPGKRSHVGGEEPEEQYDSHPNPGICDCKKQL